MNTKKRRPSGILKHCQQDEEAKSLCDVGRIMRDKENRNNDYVDTLRSLEVKGSSSIKREKKEVNNRKILLTSGMRWI